MTVLHIFDRKYTPNFQKIDFSIYPNILYICDQNLMLVPTIKLLEFSDKNWETYERLLIFWSIFWLFFLLSKVSKMKFSSKILDIQKYNIVRHWFSSKNWIFAIFFKKVSIDGFTHFWSKIHPKFSKNRLFHIPQIYYIFVIRILCFPTIKLLDFRIKFEKLMSVFWFFGLFFYYFFYCPKFQKWNFIKNPWYTKIQHCTTLIFLKKLDFCDFF